MAKLQPVKPVKLLKPGHSGIINPTRGRVGVKTPPRLGDNPLPYPRKGWQVGLNPNWPKPAGPNDGRKPYRGPDLGEPLLTNSEE